MLKYFKEFVRFHYKTLLLLAPLVLIMQEIKSQNEGYKIEFKIKNIPDSIFFIAHYYGDKTYLDDTAVAGKTILFKGKKNLADGIYILAGQKNRIICEFIILGNQNLYFEAEYPEIITSFKTKDPENQVFYDYLRINSKNYAAIDKAKKHLKETTGQDSLSYYKNEIKKINREMEDYKTELVRTHPGRFISKMIRLMQDLELPEPYDNPDSHADSLKAWIYLKQHYWDNMDFSFEGLLRTPVFHRKLDNFFKEIVLQHPDSIIAAADGLIEKSKINREYFKYCIWFITNKYELSNIMGFDKIFVHQVEKYYQSGEAYWADSSLVTSISRKAAKIKKTLIGNPAPELIIIDTSMAFTSLYGHNSDYTIILFYESDCGHCKKEIKLLQEFTDTLVFDLKVFAVNTDSDLEQWKKFVAHEKTEWIHVNATRSITPDYHELYNISITPTIFLLDRNKTIIAKGLRSGQLIPFLEQYRKSHP